MSCGKRTAFFKKHLKIVYKAIAKHNILCYYSPAQHL